MRGLDPDVLAGALPMVLASMDDGVDMIMVSNRWLTPLHWRGTLRILFVLPADAEPDQLRTWRDSVRAWNLDAGTRDAESSTQGGAARHG